MRIIRLFSMFVGIAFACLQTAQAAEQPLTIGFKAEPFAIDPHFQNGPVAHATNRHIFDRLVDYASGESVKPSLATSWEAVGDNAWVFHLRSNVKFHDGSPFTAEDVAATIRRIPTANNNTGPFSSYIRDIQRIEVRDPLTVVFHTSKPAPMLPSYLAMVSIISAKFEKAGTAEFNNGTAAIGTGPFRFSSYKRTQALELARNDDYWDGKPDWTRVTFRYIPDDATRIAALIAGEIDIATTVLGQDRDTIARQKHLQVWTGPSFRIVFLNFDLGNKITPHATDHNGNPLPSNPLLDIRVRRAIAAAIQQEVIVDRIMLGIGLPIAQMASGDTVGHVPGLSVRPNPPPDPRALLREAGYPNGFRLVIHTSPTAARNAPSIAQAIATMLGRAGITSTVESQPWQVYIGEIMKSGGPAYAAFMMSWSNLTGSSMSAMTSLLHTTDRKRNLGAQNQSRYSSPEMEALVEKAASTFDPVERGKILQDAMRKVVDDVALIPLFVQVGLIGARKGLVYETNPREHLHAHEIRLQR